MECARTAANADPGAFGFSPPLILPTIEVLASLKAGQALGAIIPAKAAFGSRVRAPMPLAVAAGLGLVIVGSASSLYLWSGLPRSGMHATRTAAPITAPSAAASDGASIAPAPQSTRSAEHPAGAKPAAIVPPQPAPSSVAGVSSSSVETPRNPSPPEPPPPSPASATQSPSQPAPPPPPSPQPHPQPQPQPQPAPPPAPSPPAPPPAPSPSPSQPQPSPEPPADGGTPDARAGHGATRPPLHPSKPRTATNGVDDTFSGKRKSTKPPPKPKPKPPPVAIPPAPPSDTVPVVPSTPATPPTDSVDQGDQHGASGWDRSGNASGSDRSGNGAALGRGSGDGKGNHGRKP